MKKETTSEHEFPDVKIIDLDKLDDNTAIDYEEISNQESMTLNTPDTGSKEISEKKSIFDHILKINWHLVLLVVFVVSVLFIIHRFRNWGVRINLDDLEFEDDDYYQVEVLDNILPLIYNGDAPAVSDGETNIVLLGNDTFAQNRGTSDDIANRISELSGATVYNCAISDSYLTATNYTHDPSVDPMDAFNFYWLSTLICFGNTDPMQTVVTDYADRIPADANEVFETLCSIDFNYVDVIGIMYDANDYLDGKPLINHEKHNDIQTYLGNLEAGLSLLQDAYPHIRIIVMSPTYAYAIDENGVYTDSELYTYDQYTLSYYSTLIEQTTSAHGITFVDNLYGTVNAVNADNYLLDHVNLNVAGREKLAERFVYALEYYDGLKDKE